MAVVLVPFVNVTVIIAVVVMCFLWFLVRFARDLSTYSSAFQLCSLSVVAAITRLSDYYSIEEVLWADLQFMLPLLRWLMHGKQTLLLCNSAGIHSKFGE